MEKPSLEEVKRYFSNAKIIQCIFNRHLKSEININDIDFKYDEYWVKIIDSEPNLWDEELGYAKILTYKNTEPKFEITKEQILELSDKFGNDNSSLAKHFLTEHLEKMFPEVFENVLEVGKWYYQDTYGKTIFFITKIEKGMVYAYGTNYKGIYKNESEWFDINQNKQNEIRLATREEACEVLEAQAVKLGYKEGVVVMYGRNEKTRLLNSEKAKYFERDNSLCVGGYEVFKAGVWHEIIPTKTIQEAEELLKELGHNFKIV